MDLGEICDHKHTRQFCLSSSLRVGFYSYWLQRHYSTSEFVLGDFWPASKKTNFWMFQTFFHSNSELLLLICCGVVSEFIRTVLTVWSSFLWVYFGTISKIQCKTAQTLLANWITLLAKLLYKLFSGTSIEMLFSRVSIEIFMYALNKGLNPPKYVRIS